MDKRNVPPGVRQPVQDPDPDALERFDFIHLRHERIAALAYSLAESRGFAGAGEFDDWLVAERLVDEGLNS